MPVGPFAFIYDWHQLFSYVAYEGLQKQPMTGKSTDYFPSVRLVKAFNSPTAIMTTLYVSTEQGGPQWEQW